MARYVEILEAGAKNFFRFGDVLVKFEIHEGLTNIFGKNGSGKSTILEIIHYVFFGESYRGVNLAQLINDSNGKGLFAYVIIRVTENGQSDTYVIQRGMEPKIQRIYKNDSKDPMKSYSNFDKHISDILLGFSSNTHKKIISVSSGGTPFLKMKLEEKRQIIDNITNISETKEYKLLVQNKLSETNTRCRLVESEINLKKSTVVPYMEMLSRNSLDIDSRIEENLGYITRLQVQLSQYEVEHGNKSDELSELMVQLASADINEKALLKEYEENNPKELNNKLIEVNSSLKYLKEKAKDAKNEINKINPNVECTHCGNSYSVDQANTKRAEKSLVYDAIVLEGREAKATLDSINEKIAELGPLIEKIREAQNSKNELTYSIQNKKHDITLINQSIRHCNDSMSEYSKKIVQLQLDRDSSTNISEVKNKIAEINAEISTLEIERAELLETVDAYEYMIKMFSDEGIKSFILKKVLPILNRLINYYLKIFAIGVVLTIKPDYSHEMESKPGLAKDYDGLSGGQKQRINLAILFAQTDLIKLMGNFKTNILFLDEFIDGAVDSEGLNDTLRIMKQVAERDNKSIVFISHRLDENIIREIDHFYEAIKIDDSYSTFNKKKNEEVLEILNMN